MRDSRTSIQSDTAAAKTLARLWTLAGRVQAVGYRPFVYRMALRYALSGWVRNRGGQVEIHAQGEESALDAFNRALINEAPPLAQPRILSVATVEPQAAEGFVILNSAPGLQARVHVPPDYFACGDCLQELHDHTDRRYRYPFINCTQCGPRYTLIRRLPYDRPNTTMANFALCEDCRREYNDPKDRRFHAEPLACPNCGPELEFASPGTTPIKDTQGALAAGVAALRAGYVLAVKGIGGYHLMCDASNAVAVARLRARKPRPHKPLAVMFPAPSIDPLAAARAAVVIGDVAERMLCDPMRPVVLCEKHVNNLLCEVIAPQLNEVGVMLPYSPLHHLLLEDFAAPVVTTSANLSGEPVLIERHDVENRLAHVADAYLHHNRPIERPADDCVYRPIAGRARPLRLGRGGAPLERDLPFHLNEPLLALGGHMKNTVALAWDGRVVISPHIGDLESPRGLAVFEQTIHDLQSLYQVKAAALVCDAHPGYGSTRWAKRSGLPVTSVYHHRAHASALAGEFPGIDNWLTFTWDGVGYGEDGTLWGGEALFGRPGCWRRAARLRPFRLPGGERAAREPWRSAAALCWETGTTWSDCPQDTTLLYSAWQQGTNAPLTSAAGRLFDAAASLTGLLHHASFEGQGPMYLEAACAAQANSVALPLRRSADGLWEIDWSPLVARLLDASLPPAQRAADFHASLVEALRQQAVAVRRERKVDAVGLCGGVFQNRILSEGAIAVLQEEGFAVYLAQSIPCNDAGISFGQIIELQAQLTLQS